ncbi:MAG: hypothetical protein HY862_21395 [Chloroflexi bacterium]|nr:hypothetical protein [Chloroflexota bacterium]
MNHSLDRDTRKALVRLAEQDEHDYSVPARIVLALSSGQEVDQIARSIRRPSKEVHAWVERYQVEGLALFGEAIQSASPIAVKPLPAKEELPKEPKIETPEREQGERRRVNPRQPRPRTPYSQRPPEEAKKPVRKPQRGRSDRRDYRRPREDKPPEAEAPIISVDDAVAEGLEFLLVESADDVVVEIAPRVVVAHVEPKPPSIEPVAPDITEPISIGALAASFDVDMAHARHISTLSRELFDITASVHRLPQHYRDLLHAAALLHNITFASDPLEHHLSGRDLILQYELKDISTEERQIIAVMTGLHRTLPRSHQVPATVKLPKHILTHAETLAALLRMGIGLDFSHTQTSVIQNWRSTPGTFILEINGREAAVDVVRAEQKSDLWNRLYKEAQIRFVTTDQGVLKTADAPELWPALEPLASAVEVSNALRVHYVRRLEYVAGRFRNGESGMLTAMWVEFQRLVGVWDWLIPGTKPSRIDDAITHSLANAIKSALYGAALFDRSTNLLDETDPDHDDPDAIAQLTAICKGYEVSAAESARQLQGVLRSQIFYQWLAAAQTKLVYQKEDPAPYSGLIATRVWAYLGGARQVIDRVTRAGWNANLEILLSVEMMQSFEVVLRRLTDSLICSGSLLGSELEQVLEVVEPLLDYLHAWQRMEFAAARTMQDWERAKIDPTQAGSLRVLAMEALATMLRERADAMRWNLPEIWAPLDSPVFRRTLALTVAKP